ncbi:uncharacterized protein LOC143833155 isoform X2 [Paroedura picta]
MMKTIELQEKVTLTEDWIDEVQKRLLKHFHAIQENILYLIKLCHPILQEREKMRRKSAARVGIFKAWRDKVAEKPSLAEPLTAEQMVEDDVHTLNLTNEINDMILEVADLSLFNKGEVNAVKYMAAMVANLAKAFGLLSRQCRSLKIKLEVGAAESRKQDPQITSLQRELRMIIEKKAALEMQVQHAEERCKVLLTTNEAMQRELRSAYERAQVSKTSLGKFPSSKIPQEQEKPQVDLETDENKKASVKQLPKFQPPARKGPGMEIERSSSLEEVKKQTCKAEIDDTEMSAPVASMAQTPPAQDTQIKRTVKFQGEERMPQIVPQTSPRETAPLEKKSGLEFPIQKAVEPTPKLKADRVPTAIQDSKKTKLQISQLAAASVTESPLPQSSEAGPQGGIQEITPEGGPSSQPLAENVHTPSIQEDIDFSAKKLVTEPPIDKAKPSSIQTDRQPTLQKLSLKQSVRKIIHSIRFQKNATFQGDIADQVPLTAPDTSEMLDAELPDGSPSLRRTAEKEESESQDAGKTQAQSQEIAILKEETEMIDPRNILAERPTDISEREAEKSKQAKFIRYIIHDLGTQLQEIAREKGGVIKEETLKELFEELDITSEDDLAEQMYGSLPPADILAKAPIMKRPESEQLPKSRESIDEASSGQDMQSALQEFQASILACIDDKLERLKKFPSESLTQPMKPTNPEVQHLYEAIDRKLDECFSAMKPKYRRAMMSQRSPSLRSEEEEHLSPPGTQSVFSQESSVSSLSPPEGEQQMFPKVRKLSKLRPKYLKKVQAASPDLQKQQEKIEDSSKSPYLKEEKVFHLPEVVLRVQEEKRQATEPQLAARQSLTESSSQQGLWFMHLQERLEWEKERLQEEQSRLQDERLRLCDEEQYLNHWQHLFEGQQEQWNQRRQQQQEQEILWSVQLEYWQQLKQDYDEQQQYWRLQQEQQQEQLRQLREELQMLQQQYEQQLLLKKEQIEEQGRWEQVHAWRKEQLRTWQAEQEEREKQRSQWQQQLVDHDKQLEAWQQEKVEQELQYKKWQEKQREQLQAQERVWQQRYQQQQQRWQRQMQWHQAQQRKQQTQFRKVQERQKQIRNEEKILAPQFQMIRTSIQGESVKEVQWKEPKEPTSIKIEAPTYKAQLPPTTRTDYLLPATRKTGRLPTTPQLSPESSHEYLDSFDLDSTLLSKPLLRDDGFPAPGLTEKRYSINVEEQRRNLELLEEVNQKAGLDSDLYIKAKEAITQALHSNAERLALFFRKYIAFSRLQEVRRTITAGLEVAKNDKDGTTMKNLYKVVDRLDAYQQKVLGDWTSSQKAVEKERQHNIENMIVLFDQLQLNYGLQLSPPYPMMRKASGTSKETQHLPHIGPVYLRPKVYRSPLFAMKKPIAFSAIVRDEGSEQIESLWQTGITELSIPLGPKTPVSLLWSQTYGFPDIPRLLELDITSLRNKPLQEIKTRVQSIPRWKLSEYKFNHL